MNGQWPVIILLVALGIMVWSSFVWRRKFLEAEKEGHKYSVRVSQLEIANHKQQETLRGFKQNAYSLKAENMRLKDYVRVLESSRAKPDATRIQYGKIRNEWDIPKPRKEPKPTVAPRLGVVEFDSKAGRWTITYPD